MLGNYPHTGQEKRKHTRKSPANPKVAVLFEKSILLMTIAMLRGLHLPADFWLDEVILIAQFKVQMPMVAEKFTKMLKLTKASQNRKQELV